MKGHKSEQKIKTPQPTTLSQFKHAFTERMKDVVGKRISNQVSTINRRLDALARLLERNQICVAVRYDPILKKIIISSNKVFQTSRESNKSIVNIRKLMELLASHESTMDEIIDKLSTIIAENVSQEFRFECAGITLEELKEETKSHLTNLFYSGDTTKAWEELRDTANGTFDDILVRRTSRLARDFMKLRKSVLELTHEESEEKGFLEALRIRKFDLCRAGAKDAHAEMRQADEMIGNKNKVPYLGISKLCCARCALVVETLPLETRGQHGRVFNSWPTPAFFKSSPQFLGKFLGDNAASIYSSLSHVDKSKALKIIENGKIIMPKKNPNTKMFPDTSSSDEFFGISDEELNQVDVSDIFNGNLVKTYNSEAYKNLREEEDLSIPDISNIFEDSPEKISSLGSSATLQFLRNYVDSDDMTFDKLSELYDEDSELFAYVIGNEVSLIDQAGFETTVECYRIALEREKEYYNDSCNFGNPDDLDVDQVAESIYQDENGWDYKERSNDSENRFGYSSEDEAQSENDFCDSECSNDSAFSFGYNSDS